MFPYLRINGESEPHRLFVPWEDGPAHRKRLEHGWAETENPSQPLGLAYSSRFIIGKSREISKEIIKKNPKLVD